MYLTDSENKLTVYEINTFNTIFDNQLPASFLDFYLKIMEDILIKIKMVIRLCLAGLTL